jgi:serine/threonine-protein kinase
MRSFQGLVHRDLKPHNLLLTGSGASPIAKVADFGLSKAFDAAGLSGQTRTGLTAGTPLFMPRQQVINFEYAKPDVDVWAMAATMYHMLTGRFPRNFVRGKDPWQTVLQTDPVPIRKRDSSIPPKLTGLLDDQSIKTILAEEKSAEDACRRLVNTANDAGGRDNITAVVLGVS